LLQDSPMASLQSLLEGGTLVLKLLRRFLGKMHPKEDNCYTDLLKAKIHYLRTREFRDDKGNRTK